MIDEKGLCQGEKEHVILVENSCIKAKFRQADKSTGQPISGAKLQLTDDKGTVVETWVSGEKPYRIYRIPKKVFTH